MRFTPKTEEELEMEGVLPKGIYPFSVLKAEHAVSKKSGADMIKLSLRLYGDGRDAFATDYLMEAMAFKLAHFCEQTGLSDRYNSGELEADDCENREGWVRVDVKKDDYGTKNEVKDYVSKPETSAAQTRPAPKSRPLVDDDDDMVPF